MNKKHKRLLTRIIIAAFLTAVLSFVQAEQMLRLFLYLIPYFIIGYDILRKAIYGILNRQIFDENFLMAIATIGALFLALMGKGDYIEAIAVMLFYQIGELFQSYAVGKSRRSISALMDIRPDYANIERDNTLVQLDPDEVEIGSIIIVQPGEKVPIDGIITEGSALLDTSALTGESVPRNVNTGDEIISGCINLNGVLKIKTTKNFCDSTVSKILDLVENASSRKSKSENFISKFAGIYTPAVCIGALLLFALPPLISIFFLRINPQWSQWLYRALTFLVVSCPCALVISIPLSFFAGIGGASREGILIKGSNYLETLSKVKHIVFDKTGTLTEGIFSINEIHHNSIDENMLIEYAALSESSSTHPISKGIQNAYKKIPDRSRVSDIKELSGMGVSAKVDGKEILVGNSKLMEYRGISYIPCSSSDTVVHIAVCGEYAGHMLISDAPKRGAKEAISKLKAMGIKEIVMLTGDTEGTAKKVAHALNIERVYASLLPQDKVTKLEELLQEKTGGSFLAFVGDGINDAPVLSRADIGIAMGAMGSDAAIEAADVVLMDDDPQKISKAIKISKKCLSIVYQNCIFAILVKLLCLLSSTFGITNMYFAIFADVGVMVLAVLNSIRALYAKI